MANLKCYTQAHHRQVIVGLGTVAVLLNGGGERFDDLPGILEVSVAEEVKQAAGEALEMHDVEREIRKGRIHAEAEHQDAVRQMKKDVESEAKELKQLLKEVETPSPAEESK